MQTNINTTGSKQPSQHPPFSCGKVWRQPSCVGQRGSCRATAISGYDHPPPRGARLVAPAGAAARVLPALARR
jgi:hypothetical protein